MNCKTMLIVILCALFVGLGVNEVSASQAVIYRDNYGVPHIYSGSLEGLFYGFGYTVAQDRLFQLEMLRRIYYGKVSEVLGADYYNFDVVMRRDNLSQTELQAQFQALDKKYQTILQAYADGVNAWIDEVLADPNNKLPYEFHQLGFTPEKWTVLDMTTPYLAVLGLFMDLSNELENAAFYNYLNEKFGYQAQSYFDDMIWVKDPGAPTTIPSYNAGGNNYLAQTQYEKLNKVGINEAAKIIKNEKDMVKTMLEQMGFQIPEKLKNGSSKLFSYCTVIGGEKSKTGSPLLMGGPQFGFWLPSMLHEVGLHGAGIDVVGSTLTGTPFIMFGHSRHTAFGATAGAGNIQDIFEETLSPYDPGYVFGNANVQIQERIEFIKVKGEDRARKAQILQTVHGSIFTQLDTNNDGRNDVAYTKKLACRSEYLQGLAAFYDLMVAQNPADFIKAGQTNPLSLNFFYADNHNNIGYYHCGKYPIRSQKIDPRFPTPGTGDYEWAGYMPNEEHPYIINPYTNILVNWNNKPSPDFNNGDLSGIFGWGGWGEDHRVNRLNDLINAKSKLDIQDLENIIRDIAEFDLKAGSFKQYLLQALNRYPDPALNEAKKYLANWNNHRHDENNDGFYDSVGITIFTQWWSIVNERIFADELGPYWTLTLENYAGYSLLARIVKGANSTLPLQNDYTNGVGWEKIFVDSLKEAVAQLTQKYGTSDVSKWVSETKMMGMIPANLYGIPASLGSVPLIKYMDRGTENHIVSVGRPFVRGENVLPPGQNGFISKDGTPGKHFSDQLDLFATWKYKPMLFQRDDIFRNTESYQIIYYKN